MLLKNIKKDIMKILVAFFLLLSVIIGCNHPPTTKKINLLQDSLIKGKALLLTEIDMLENTVKKVNYFNSHQSDIPRTEIDMSWLDSLNYHPDRGAFLYESEGFKVLQVTTCGSLGKVDLFLFFNTQNIFHLRQIVYQYNHPYDLPNFKIAKADTLDFFLYNKEISIFKHNSSKSELNEKIKKDAYDALSEGEKILLRINK